MSLFGKYARRHKFNAKRTELAGYSFASALEADLFKYLKVLELAGEIKDIQVQPHVKLTRAGIKMIPDFKAFDIALGEYVWFEAKGFVTAEYQIKRKLWAFYGPGQLRVYKRAGKSDLYHFETVDPKDSEE